jgi:hypothetical protein
MKKLIIILAILTSFTSKAQQFKVGHYDSNGNVTYYTQDTIHLPYSVAKTIAKELVECDSTKAILEVTKEQLTLTESKVYLKDLTIETYVQKGIMYEKRIKNEQLKYDIRERYIGVLEKNNKKLKVKLAFTKITLGGIISGLTYLYITK